MGAHAQQFIPELIWAEQRVAMCESFRLTGSLLREKEVSPKSSRRRKNTTPNTIARVKPQVLAEISALSQAEGWSRAAQATKRVHRQLEQFSETPCQNKSTKRAGDLA